MLLHGFAQIQRQATEVSAACSLMLLENCIQIIPIRRGQAVPKELSFLSLLLIVQALVKKEWNSALGSSSPVFSNNVSEILACWSLKGDSY